MGKHLFEVFSPLEAFVWWSAPHDVNLYEWVGCLTARVVSWQRAWRVGLSPPGLAVCVFIVFSWQAHDQPYVHLPNVMSCDLCPVKRYSVASLVSGVLRVK